MNGMTKIIGEYYTDGIDIYKHLKDGRWKRLKPLARDCFVLTVNSKRYYGTRAKMIWCAEHKVSPDAVDAKFSFKMVDGHSEVMMFADKMRDVRIDYNEKVKASWQDYDYIERFAHLAKAHLQGDKTAASQLYQMLSSERNDLLAYAMGGGQQVDVVSREPRNLPMLPSCECLSRPSAEEGRFLHRGHP